MIITIKGANFSENNIGTLTTWRITKSYNANAVTVTSGNIPDSIDREGNSGINATLTVNEGYELNGTVAVTMGGSAVTSGVTVSGNTVTISIGSVTGNVVISVPTKSAAGEEPETPTNYTFTINPTPTSATITLSATGYSTVSGTGSQSITVADGTTVSYTVSADGYTTQSGTWTANGSNKAENVALTASSGGSSGQITTTYSLPSFVSVSTGQLATTSNTWIHSDFISVNDLSNNTEDGKCVKTFISHGTVAAIAFYSQPNFDSYVEGFILTDTAGKSEAQTAEQVKACITKDNANYVVFSTDGAKATLSVTTGEGSIVTPEPEEPENPSTGTSGINYYEEPGYIAVSNGQITNTSSDWIHSDFIKISDLQDDATLGHCIGKFTGHGQVADIAFYSSNNFNSYITGKTSSGATRTVETLQTLMTELNATNATYIVISTDKTKNQLYACLK